MKTEYRTAQNAKVRFDGTRLEYSFKRKNTKVVSLIVLTTGVALLGVIIHWIMVLAA